MKEIFVDPEIEIILFDADDVITASTNCTQPQETVELEIVPSNNS